MTCPYAFISAEGFQQQWFWSFDEEATVELEPLMKSSAGRIWAAMASSGQSTCTLAFWATDYLKELNAVAAAIMLNAPCIRLSQEQRELFATYLNDQLTLIRTGETALCDGHTGTNYPAFAVAQYGVTDRNVAQMDGDRFLRQMETS